MKFGGNKRLLKELEKVRLEVLILETFILVLIRSGTKTMEGVRSVERY